MSGKIQRFQGNVLQARDADKLLQYNDMTAENGLAMTREQAMELLETRAYELRYSGRLEFGEGILGKLIEAFRGSPYISQQNYVQTLHGLVEIFYYYKNETDEKLSDNDLIEYMAEFFNGSCMGSLELLSAREMDALAREVRRRRCF